MVDVRGSEVVATSLVLLVLLVIIGALLAYESALFKPVAVGAVASRVKFSSLMSAVKMCLDNVTVAGSPCKLVVDLGSYTKLSCDAGKFVVCVDGLCADIRSVLGKPFSSSIKLECNSVLNAQMISVEVEPDKSRGLIRISFEKIG